MCYEVFPCVFNLKPNFVILRKITQLPGAVTALFKLKDERIFSFIFKSDQEPPS